MGGQNVCVSSIPVGAKCIWPNSLGPPNLPRAGRCQLRSAQMNMCVFSSVGFYSTEIILRIAITITMVMTMIMTIIIMIIIK